MTKTIRIPGAPRLWRIDSGPPPRRAHVALVPGVDVPLLPVDLPQKLKGAARERVAERQLVEALSLSSDRFEMHPFLPKTVKVWNSIALVNVDQAKAWRKQVTRRCQGVVPDFFALPTGEGLWTVESVDGLVLARLGLTDGFSAETDLAIAQLKSAPSPKAILRLGDPDDRLDAFLGKLEAPTVRDPNDLKKLGIRFSRWGDTVGGINLKDRPSVALDRARASIRRWRMAITASLLATAVWAGGIWMDIQDTQRLTQENQETITRLVREHFVPNGPILDVRAQVSRVVDAAQAPDAVEIDTLPPLTQFQVAAPALVQDGTRLVSVNFRPESGLVVSVEAEDFAALDALVIGLQDAEFLVEQLESGAQSSGGVAARIRLELFE